MNNLSFISEANRLGKLRQPFYFLVDFELEKPQIFTSLSTQFFYSSSPSLKPKLGGEKFSWNYPLAKYAHGFSHIQAAMKNGRSWLVNYTAQSKLTTKYDWNLRELAENSPAKARVFYDEGNGHSWLSQSPESFIEIRDNSISTRPMKGTRPLSASLSEDTAALLADEKEAAEHLTVVDLLRNDLGRVGSKVRVEKYRYIDLIPRPQGPLLASSSHITAELSADWHEKIGEILLELLPAGSVSGAPKKETCSIISEAEETKRGYYTGIAGYFDGSSLEAFVLIRFLEKIQGDYFYRSGGGVTIYSDLEAEFRELGEKIYV